MDWLNGFELGTLAYAGVFLGALIAFEGARQTLTRSESLGEAKSRRMRMVAAGSTTEERLRLLKPDSSGWSLARMPFVGTLPGDLAHAGMTVSAGLVLTSMAGGAVILALALSLVLPPLAAVALAAIVMVLLPVAIIRRKAKQRLDLLSRQLPEALELMGRGLTVGHPLNATITSVASDMKDPIATEFGIIVDQVSYGDDLVDAFAAFAERTGLEDVRYLAVSVGIQHGTGGNLAGVLNTLATVIRDRMSMRKRIKAISAEGRLTSKFLSSLPLVILAATSITAPTYYSGVANEPLFKPVAMIIAGLVVANYLIMRRLVDFRI
ncbi:MAG: type II secretion system F family protein [Albidovulum sp.]